MRSNEKFLSTLFIAAIICGVFIGISTGDDGNNVDAAINSYLKGNDLVKQSRYEEALTAFETATTQDSHYSNGWYGKGNTLYILGRYSEALVAFETVLTLDPDHAKAWAMKGDTLMKLKNYQTAADSYDRVIKLYPNDETAKTNKENALSLANKGTSSSSAAVTSIIPTTVITTTQPGLVLPSFSLPPFLLPLVIILIVVVIIGFFVFQMKKKPGRKIEPPQKKVDKGPEFKSQKSHGTNIHQSFDNIISSVRSLPKWEFRALCMIIVILFLLLVFSLAGFLPGHSAVSGSALSPYKDPSNYYSLNKPGNWKVTTSDAIVISDPSDNGATFVLLEPVLLNGQYTKMNSRDIANYLVGNAKTTMAGFTLEDVRESADGKFLELTVSYDYQGTKKRGVYTLFVNSPYALLSGYESPVSSFAAKEPLMREILGSYSQLANPVSSQSTGTNQVVTSNQPQISTIGPLRSTMQDNGVKMLLPAGWTATVLPGCSGLSASDGNTPGRGILFLSGLHQGVDPLPGGVTPEQYVTSYMPADFAKYGTTITNVKVTGYEQADLSSLGGTGSSQVKAMRISFNLNGVPCTGSLTVGTSSPGGYLTSISYLYGIYAPTASFFTDAPTLLQIWNSIDYSSSTTAACRGALNAAWSGANSIGDSIRTNGEQMRNENLEGFYNRQDVYDTASAKRSDMILGVDRVYNPDTDEVYEVDQNFYQYYDLNRDQYKYQDMRELQPDEFLKYSPLNGELRIQ